MVSLVDDGLLVVAVGLVASRKFRKTVNVAVPVGISLNDDLVGSGTLHHAGVLCKDADTGVYGSLCLDTGSDNRRLRLKKRNGLTLHVGTHQGTVGIVVLQERDHGSCHGEYHLRGYVHQVDGTLLERRGFLTETSGNIVVDKVSVLVKRFVGLGHDEIVFLVGRQVNHLVRNPRVCRIALVDGAVGCLNEAVLVHPRIGGQGVDQTDVRSLRRLDGAHTAVVGVVYVSNLETGTVPGKTAGAQGGETSLVGQLGKRIVLIHELRKLGASEEFLHSRRHRLDVD